MKHSKNNSRTSPTLSIVGEEQILTHKAASTLAQGLKRKLLNHDSVSDDIFDLLYSPEVRRFSQVHWTPLEVALKAVEILQLLKVERLLDVGSGCGKFCILSAILTDIQITGVEQREFLASSSKKVRNLFQLENLNFITGSAFDLSWKEFDCIYFYNPFCEQKHPERRIQNDLPMSEANYHSFLQLTHDRLREQKVGSKVMTYHGTGGALPDEYSLYYQKRVGSDFLKVWMKNA